MKKQEKNPELFDAESALYEMRKLWVSDRESAIKLIKKLSRLRRCDELHGMAMAAVSVYDEVMPSLPDFDNAEAAKYFLNHMRQLAAHIFSTVKNRRIMHTLCYAELLAECNIEKACRLIREALKKESEQKRYEVMQELCRSTVKPFVNLAHRELKRMALRGCKSAMRLLGYSYFRGQNGFIKSDKQAFRWWKMGADAGCEVCMLEVSLMYEHGEGMRPNRKKAFLYVQKSARKDYLPAVCNLGYCYYWGIGTQRNFALAVDCFRKAIELGDVTVSAHNLAERYYSGQGVEKDYEKAIYYHRMAARHRYPDSICRLGYMNIHGEGMPVNIKNGLRLLRQSVKLGGARALCELGKCYEQGLGVPKNLQKAMQLYAESDRKRYPEAKRCMSRLKRKM